LTAQSYRASRRNRNRRGTQTTSVEQKKTKETNKKKTDSSAATNPSQSSSNKPSAKFDPKKPILTQKQIDSGMNEIRQRLLECKIREKMADRKDDDGEDSPEDEEKKEDAKKSKKDTFISRLDFSIMLSRYKTLIDNFELTEVSRIRPEWYQQFQTELGKFGPIINEMTIAMRAESSGRYAAAVQKFKAHQKACLKFLKEKRPKITSEEYQALLLKNTRIRQQNYQKMLQEKRQAAMKRRQEELKQLQQKNQQKNQGQKKDQKTANKK
jgi:hypothetical protein